MGRRALEMQKVEIRASEHEYYNHYVYLDRNMT